MRGSAVGETSCPVNPTARTRATSRALCRPQLLLAFAVAGFALPLGLAPLAPAHAAGGAFIVDDSEIAGTGNCKVESFGAFADNHDILLSSTPACVFNIFQPVEIGTQFQRFRFGGVWDTSLTMRAKTNFVSIDKGGLGVAASGGLTYDLNTGEYLGAFVNLPVSIKVNDQWQINLNVGSFYDNPNNLLWLTWGAGFEWNFVPKTFTLLGEVFGQLGHRDPLNSAVSDPRAQIGLRYNPRENIDIDLIYGRNVTGVDANWITLGLNVRFNVFGAPQ